MKSSLAVAACLSTAFTQARATNLDQRQDGHSPSPRVMHFHLDRAHVSDPVANDRARLARRAGTINSPLQNEQTLYFLNASLGSPPQPFRFHIDTGSSDMWVNTPASTLCRSKGNPCAQSGTYRANDSSTYQYVNSNFNISYQDGSGAIGDYATDVLLLQGHNITDMEFAIGYRSSSSQSLLGIGYPTIEAEVTQDPDVNPYRNLPAKLAADKLIASSAYSLWLNDLQASTGSLLFGGVDRAQYSGDLRTVDIQKIAGGYNEFIITMTGLVFDGSDLVSDSEVPVLLDSGTSLTYLPNDVVSSIYDSINARYIEDAGLALVDCSLADSNTQVEYQFSNDISIKVGMDELVLTTQDVTQTGNRGLQTLRRRQDLGQNAPCVFGIAPAEGTQAVLGDTFLRSAYVVYDLTNNQVSLAQTSFNATKNDIVEIGTGANAVPHASGEADETDDNSDTSGAAPMAGSGPVTLWPVLTVVVGAGLGFTGFLL